MANDMYLDEEDEKKTELNGTADTTLDTARDAANDAVDTATENPTEVDVPKPKAVTTPSEPTYSSDEMFNHLRNGTDYTMDEINAMSDSQYKQYTEIAKHRDDPNDKVRELQQKMLSDRLALSDELEKKAEFVVEHTKDDKDYAEDHDNMAYSADWLRNHKTAFAKMSEEDIATVRNDIERKYDEAAKRVGHWEHLKNQFAKGYISCGNMLYQGMKMTQPGTLDDWDKDQIRGTMQYEKDLEIENPQKVGGFENIKSVGDFADYLSETVAGNVPRAAASVGLAVAGAHVFPVHPVAGAMLFGTLGTMWMNTGEAVQDILNEKRGGDDDIRNSRLWALLQGLGYSILDGALGVSAMGAKLWGAAMRKLGVNSVKDAVKGAGVEFAKDVAGKASLKGIGKDILVHGVIGEGVQEAAQSQIVGRGVRAMQTGSLFKRNEDGTYETPKEAWWEAANEFVGGAASGVAFGLVGGGAANIDARRTMKIHTDDIMSAVKDDKVYKGMGDYPKLLVSKALENEAYLSTTHYLDPKYMEALQKCNDDIYDEIDRLSNLKGRGNERARLDGQSAKLYLDLFKSQYDLTNINELIVGRDAQSGQWTCRDGKTYTPNIDIEGMRNNYEDTYDEGSERRLRVFTNPVSGSEVRVAQVLDKEGNPTGQYLFANDRHMKMPVFGNNEIACNNLNSALERACDLDVFNQWRKDKMAAKAKVANQVFNHLFGSRGFTLNLVDRPTAGDNANATTKAGVSAQTRRVDLDLSKINNLGDLYTTLMHERAHGDIVDFLLKSDKWSRKVGMMDEFDWAAFEKDRNELFSKVVDEHGRTAEEISAMHRKPGAKPDRNGRYSDTISEWGKSAGTAGEEMVAERGSVRKLATEQRSADRGIAGVISDKSYGLALKLLNKVEATPGSTLDRVRQTVAQKMALDMGVDPSAILPDAVASEMKHIFDSGYLGEQAQAFKREDAAVPETDGEVQNPAWGKTVPSVNPAKDEVTVGTMNTTDEAEAAPAEKPKKASAKVLKPALKNGEGASYADGAYIRRADGTTFTKKDGEDGSYVWNNVDTNENVDDETATQGGYSDFTKPKATTKASAPAAESAPVAEESPSAAPETAGTETAAPTETPVAEVKKDGEPAPVQSTKVENAPETDKQTAEKPKPASTSVKNETKSDKEQNEPVKAVSDDTFKVEQNETPEVMGDGKGDTVTVPQEPEKAKKTASRKSKGKSSAKRWGKVLEYNGKTEDDVTSEQKSRWNELDALPDGTEIVNSKGNTFSKVPNESGTAERAWVSTGKAEGRRVSQLMIAQSGDFTVVEKKAEETKAEAPKAEEKTEEKTKVDEQPMQLSDDEMAIVLMDQSTDEAFEMAYPNLGKAHRDTIKELSHAHGEPKDIIEHPVFKGYMEVDFGDGTSEFLGPDGQVASVEDLAARLADSRSAGGPSQVVMAATRLSSLAQSLGKVNFGSVDTNSKGYAGLSEDRLLALAVRKDDYAALNALWGRWEKKARDWFSDKYRNYGENGEPFTEKDIDNWVKAFRKEWNNVFMQSEGMEVGLGESEKAMIHVKALESELASAMKKAKDSDDSKDKAVVQAIKDQIEFYTGYGRMAYAGSEANVKSLNHEQWRDRRKGITSLMYDLGNSLRRSGRMSSREAERDPRIVSLRNKLYALNDNPLGKANRMYRGMAPLDARFTSEEMKEMALIQRIINGYKQYLRDTSKNYVDESRLDKDPFVVSMNEALRLYNPTISHFAPSGRTTEIESARSKGAENTETLGSPLSRTVSADSLFYGIANGLWGVKVAEDRRKKVDADYARSKALSDRMIAEKEAAMLAEAERRERDMIRKATGKALFTNGDSAQILKDLRVEAYLGFPEYMKNFTFGELLDAAKTDPRARNAVSLRIGEMLIQRYVPKDESAVETKDADGESDVADEKAEMEANRKEELFRARNEDNSFNSIIAYKLKSQGLGSEYEGDVYEYVVNAINRQMANGGKNDKGETAWLWKPGKKTDADVKNYLSAIANKRVLQIITENKRSTGFATGNLSYDSSLEKAGSAIDASVESMMDEGVDPTEVADTADGFLVDENGDVIKTVEDAVDGNRGILEVGPNAEKEIYGDAIRAAEYLVRSGNLTRSQSRILGSLMSAWTRLLYNAYFDLEAAKTRRSRANTIKALEDKYKAAQKLSFDDRVVEEFGAAYAGMKVKVFRSRLARLMKDINDAFVDYRERQAALRGKTLNLEEFAKKMSSGRFTRSQVDNSLAGYNEGRDDSVRYDLAELKKDMDFNGDEAMRFCVSLAEQGKSNSKIDDIISGNAEFAKLANADGAVGAKTLLKNAYEDYGWIDKRKVNTDSSLDALVGKVMDLMDVPPSVSAAGEEVELDSDEALNDFINGWMKDNGVDVSKGDVRRSLMRIQVRSVPSIRPKTVEQLEEDRKQREERKAKREEERNLEAERNRVEAQKDHDAVAKVFDGNEDFGYPEVRKALAAKGYSEERIGQMMDRYDAIETELAMAKNEAAKEAKKEAEAAERKAAADRWMEENRKAAAKGEERKLSNSEKVDLIKAEIAKTGDEYRTDEEIVEFAKSMDMPDLVVNKFLRNARHTAISQGELAKRAATLPKFGVDVEAAERKIKAEDEKKRSGVKMRMPGELTDRQRKDADAVQKVIDKVGMDRAKVKDALVRQLSGKNKGSALENELRGMGIGTMQSADDESRVNLRASEMIHSWSMAYGKKTDVTTRNKTGSLPLKHYIVNIQDEEYHNLQDEYVTAVNAMEAENAIWKKLHGKLKGMERNYYVKAHEYDDENGIISTDGQNRSENEIGTRGISSGTDDLRTEQDSDYGRGEDENDFPNDGVESEMPSVGLQGVDRYDVHGEEREPDDPNEAQQFRNGIAPENRKYKTSVSPDQQMGNFRPLDDTSAFRGAKESVKAHGRWDEDTMGRVRKRDFFTKKEAEGILADRVEFGKLLEKAENAEPITDAEALALTMEAGKRIADGRDGNLTAEENDANEEGIDRAVRALVRGLSRAGSTLRMAQIGIDLRTRDSLVYMTEQLKANLEREDEKRYGVEGAMDPARVKERDEAVKKYQARISEMEKEMGKLHDTIEKQRKTIEDKERLADEKAVNKAFEDGRKLGRIEGRAEESEAEKARRLKNIDMALKFGANREMVEQGSESADALGDMFDMTKRFAGDPEAPLDDRMRKAFNDVLAMFDGKVDKAKAYLSEKYEGFASGMEPSFDRFVAEMDKANMTAGLNEKAKTERRKASSQKAAKESSKKTKKGSKVQRSLINAMVEANVRAEEAVDEETALQDIGESVRACMKLILIKDPDMKKDEVIGELVKHMNKLAEKSGLFGNGRFDEADVRDALLGREGFRIVNRRGAQVTLENLLKAKKMAEEAGNDAAKLKEAAKLAGFKHLSDAEILQELDRRIGKALNKRLNVLESRINEDEKSNEELRGQIKDLVMALRDIRSGNKTVGELLNRYLSLAEGMKDYRRQKGVLDRINSRVAMYQRKIANNDFEPAPKREAPDTAAEILEIQRAMRRLEKMRETYKNERKLWKIKRQPWLSRQFSSLFEILGEVKALAGSLDLSSVLRQGGQMTWAHPLLAVKNLRRTMDVLKSDEAADRAFDSIWERPNAPYYRKAGLDITTYGTNSGNSEDLYLLNKFRTITNNRPMKFLIGASERGFTMFLNLMRADVFDAIVKCSPYRDASKMDVETLKAIGKYINVASQRGNFDSESEWAAKVKDALPALNAVLWSPRNIISRIQFIVNTAKLLLPGVKAYGTADWKARKMLAKETGRYFLGVGAAIAFTKMMADLFRGDDEPPEDMVFDPRSSEFLQVKIGNTHLDFLSGLKPMIVFAARLKTGKTVNSRGQERTANAKELIGNLIRSKFAPASGIIWDWYQGETFDRQDIVYRNPFKWTDEEMGIASFLFGQIAPLSIKDIIEQFVNNGPARGMITTLYAMLGAGANTYNPNTYKQLKGDYHYYRRLWRDAETDEERRELVIRHPMLNYMGKIEAEMKVVRKYEKAIKDLTKMADDARKRGNGADAEKYGKYIEDYSGLLEDAKKVAVNSMVGFRHPDRID